MQFAISLSVNFEYQISQEKLGGCRWWFEKILNCLSWLQRMMAAAYDKSLTLEMI